MKRLETQCSGCMKGGQGELPTVPLCVCVAPAGCRYPDPMLLPLGAAWLHTCRGRCASHTAQGEQRLWGLCKRQGCFQSTCALSIYFHSRQLGDIYSNITMGLIRKYNNYCGSLKDTFQKYVGWGIMMVPDISESAKEGGGNWLSFPEYLFTS